MAMSKSQKILLWIVGIMFIAAWIGMIPADAQVFGLQLIWAPIAGGTAFYLMQFTGFFSRERLRAAADVPQEETRADEWKRKLAEGERRAQEENETSDKIVIRLYDKKHETESKIILYQNGKMEVEGNPPEDVVKMAEVLCPMISLFGVESIAEQVQQYIEETYNTEDE